jgi:uncharacterized protein involved in exopolysaccharide biosynthesis
LRISKVFLIYKKIKREEVLNESTYDIIEILRTLRKRKIFLIVCFFVPGIIALILSFLIPKRYTSETTILAPEVAAGGGIIQTPFGGFSSSGLGQNVLTSQAVIALLRSDKMLADVVEEFKLAKVLRFKTKRDAMIYLKDKMTSVEFLTDEGVIKIEVEAFSPEMSKNMIEFYLANLEKLNTELKLSVESPIVKVISPAYFPIKKSFPKTKTNIAIAGLLGLIIGLLYIYLKEKISKTT